MNNFYNDKKVLITGAGQGIGRALAHLLVKQGASVIIVDINQENTLQVVTECNKIKPDTVFHYMADVTDRDEMQKVANKALEQHKFIDIVIANAGIGKPNPGDNFDIDFDRHTMELNYFGQINTFIPFIESMKQERRGQLVGISSIAGFRGLPALASYSASKSAQTTLLESFRLDLKKYNISVTATHSGYVKTDLLNTCDFHMPFMISTTDAALSIAKAVSKHKRSVIFPFPMKIQSFISRLLPNFIYDWIVPKVFNSK